MRRLVLGIAVAVTSFMPVLGMADDQQIADFIKNRLQAEQEQGNLRGFNVDMRVEEGIVSFKGHVSNAAQEMTILKTAQRAGHLGVVRVVDDIDVNAGPEQASPYRNAGFEQSQQQSAQTYVAPQSYLQGSTTILQAPPQQRAPQLQQVQQSPQMQQQILQLQQQISQLQQQRQEQPQQTTNPYRQISTQEYPVTAVEGIVTGGDPLPFATSEGCATGSCDSVAHSAGPAPLPIPQGGGASAHSGAPNLPGYSWPGYAAHPNYAAVTYPKQYSASAWPYIGPFYPYPQVPLGCVRFPLNGMTAGGSLTSTTSKSR